MNFDIWKNIFFIEQKPHKYRQKLKQKYFISQNIFKLYLKRRHKRVILIYDKNLFKKTCMFSEIFKGIKKAKMSFFSVGSKLNSEGFVFYLSYII